MRFTVPQFIDIEDKIFGPFTFKQFAYLVGGAGISYLLWSILPTLIAIPLMLPVVALSLALTFYKINDKPFIFTLENSIRFLFKTKLYIWKHRPPEEEKEKKQEEEISQLPKISDSKLNELGWSLDVLDMNE